MPKKKILLKKLEKEVVEQEKEGMDVEEEEVLTRKRLDRVTAPGIQVEEKLKKRWKSEETEKEVTEPKEETNEGMGIEKEEEEGEDPYPEIKKVIKEDADEEEEDDGEEE